MPQTSHVIHCDVIEPRLRNTLRRAIDARVFPGCVVGVVWGNGARCIVAVGAQTYESGAAPVCGETVFDVASITKAIPTSTLALKAVEEGRISLDTRLIDYVPEFTNAYREQVTLRHLLTQTIDHGYALSSCKEMEPEHLLHTILTRDFRCAPGQRHGYSNATSILLGLMVERVWGAPLDRLAAEKLFAPLEMHDTGYMPYEGPPDRIAPTEIDVWRVREIRGEIHDESAYVLRRIMVPGSAGLYSTVPDLCNFLQMLLDGGTFLNTRILKNETIRMLLRNHLDSIGKCGTLGWELNQMRFMGLHCSVNTIGKTGFTGCMVMCDVEQGRGLVFLSNHTYPRRRENADAINAVRREIADIVFGARHLQSLT